VAHDPPSGPRSPPIRRSPDLSVPRDSPVRAVARPSSPPTVSRPSPTTPSSPRCPHPLVTLDRRAGSSLAAIAARPLPGVRVAPVPGLTRSLPRDASRGRELGARALVASPRSGRERHPSAPPAISDPVPPPPPRRSAVPGSSRDARHVPVRALCAGKSKSVKGNRVIPQVVRRLLRTSPTCPPLSHRTWGQTRRQLENSRVRRASAPRAGSAANQPARRAPPEVRPGQYAMLPPPLGRRTWPVMNFEASHAR